MSYKSAFFVFVIVVVVAAAIALSPDKSDLIVKDLVVDDPATLGNFIESDTRTEWNLVKTEGGITSGFSPYVNLSHDEVMCIDTNANIIIHRLSKRYDDDRGSMRLTIDGKEILFKKACKAYKQGVVVTLHADAGAHAFLVKKLKGQDNVRINGHTITAKGFSQISKLVMFNNMVSGNG